VSIVIGQSAQFASTKAAIDRKQLISGPNHVAEAESQEGHQGLVAVQEAKGE